MILKHLAQPSTKLVIALLLLAASGFSLAQELRWYDVEVIAFAHARGEYLNTESWPQKWPQPDTQAAIDFDAVKHRLFSSRPAQGALSGIAKRVDQSSRYKLLTYKVWRQAGLAESKAAAVHIQSEVGVSSLVDKGVDPHGNIVSELLHVPALEGSIKITLGRFLHIHTDLLYYAPLEDIQILPEPSSNTAEIADVAVKTSTRLAAEGSTKNRLQGFNLKTQRKTRSQETQFIDHPMFGLIVRITPVKTS